MTAVFAVNTRVGNEKVIARRLVKLAWKCKEIISASLTPWPGYVKVEVLLGSTNKIQLPKEAKTVIELVPGVIKVLDSEPLQLN